MFQSNLEHTYSNTAATESKARGLSIAETERKRGVSFLAARNQFLHITSKGCNEKTGNRTKSVRSERILSKDFEPSPYTVIVGRGKRIAHTVGNRRLRIMAKMFLSEYAKATKSKSAKTIIVDKIVDNIQCACAENRCEGAFVRYSKGRYYEVDMSVAREKVGYQLRDLLGDEYESSSKSKVAKKQRLKRMNEKRTTKSEAKEAIDCSSSTTNNSSNEECMIHPILSVSSGLDMIEVASSHAHRFELDSYDLLNEPLISGCGSTRMVENEELSKVL